MKCFSHYWPKHGNNRQQSNITMTDICAPWEHIRWFNSESFIEVHLWELKTTEGCLPPAGAMGCRRPVHTCASPFLLSGLTSTLSPLPLLAQGLLWSLELCPHGIKPSQSAQRVTTSTPASSPGGSTEHLVPTAPGFHRGIPLTHTGLENAPLMGWLASVLTLLLLCWDSLELPPNKWLVLSSLSQTDSKGT